MFFAGIFAFISLYLSVNFAQGYLKNARYMEQSVVTQGTLIERIRVPRYKNSTLYYLRYQYENRWARQTCSVDREIRVSPRNRACSVTIDRVQVSEASYRAAVVPSQIEVSYLPSSEKTWSEVVGYSSRKTRSFVGVLGSLLFGLASGLFSIMLLRARRKDRQSL